MISFKNLELLAQDNCFSELYKEIIQEEDNAYQFWIDQRTLDCALPNLGSYDTAIAVLNKVLLACEEENDTTCLLKIYTDLGVAYYFKNDIPTSTAYYFEALNLSREFKSLKNSNQISTLLNNIGWNYLFVQDFEKAIEKIKMAIIHVPEHNQSLLARTYNNLGVAYSKVDSFDKSIEYYEKAFAINVGLMDTIEQQYNLNNIGNIYFYKGDNDMAISYYQKALKVNEEINNTEEMQNNHFNLGRAFLNMKKYETAEYHLIKSIDIAESMKDKYSKRYSIEVLIDLYEQLENYKDASHYYKELNSIRDSIEVSRSLYEVREIEAKNALVEKDKKNTALAKDNQIKELQIRNNRLNIAVISSIGLILIGVVLLLFLFLRKRTQEKKQLQELNAVINDQHTELVNKQRDLEQANKTITQINESLEERVQNKTQQLSVEKNLTDKLLNSLPGLFFFFEKKKENFELVRWNKNYESTTGYSKSELAGLNPFSFLDDQAKKIVKNQLDNAIHLSKIQFESRLKRKNGTLGNWYFVEGYYFEENNKEYYIGLSIDIEDKKRAEKELEFRSKALETQNEQLTSYAYYNAHKLRGPFCRIKGLLQLKELTAKDIIPDNVDELLDHSVLELENVINEIQELITPSEN